MKKEKKKKRKKEKACTFHQKSHIKGAKKRKEKKEIDIGDIIEYIPTKDEEDLNEEKS